MRTEDEGRALWHWTLVPSLILARQPSGRTARVAGGSSQGGGPSYGPSSLPAIALAVISLRHLVLFICIPVYNEAPTVGLLLWRLRKVFQEYSREYEVLVFDDGSTDATAETLRPYAKVLPLTTLGGRERLGYARALDALLRTAAKRTRYPRRDGAVTLQGDFTDRPEHLPELIKRFEGGADLVVSERGSDEATPAPVRRFRRLAPWVLRPFASVPGVNDPFGSLRLYRVSVIRELIKERGDTPIVDGAGWGANVDLLIGAARHARRIETVEVAPRYDLRPRQSRVRPWADAVGLFRLGRAARARWTTAEPPRTAAKAAG
jgi:glycosyltransferase involved in cell wall biosynthesis